MKTTTTRKAPLQKDYICGVNIALRNVFVAMGAIFFVKHTTCSPAVVCGKYGTFHFQILFHDNKKESRSTTTTPQTKLHPDDRDPVPMGFFPMTP